MDFKLTKLKCRRCGNEWIPRQIVVKMCPKCKNRLWDVKRGEDDKNKGKQKRDIKMSERK